MVTPSPSPFPRVLPQAESVRFERPGARAAVLLSHGFTGSPASMVPWAEHLAGHGFTTSVPRLPGHGTSWQELDVTTWQDWYTRIEQEYLALAEAHEKVFVAALSMGAALALRLAQHHDGVAGLALVNPSIGSMDRRMALLPVAKHLVRSIPGIGNDIAAPGRSEFGYDRTPLHAADSLRGLWRDVSDHLDRVEAPTLVFRSRTDHVVDDSSLDRLVERLGSAESPARLRVVSLPRSFHVATVDYDAGTIFDTSTQFFTDLLAGR